MIADFLSLSRIWQGLQYWLLLSRWRRLVSAIGNSPRDQRTGTFWNWWPWPLIAHFPRRAFPFEQLFACTTQCWHCRCSHKWTSNVYARSTNWMNVIVTGCVRHSYNDRWCRWCSHHFHNFLGCPFVQSLLRCLHFLCNGMPIRYLRLLFDFLFSSLKNRTSLYVQRIRPID